MGLLYRDLGSPLPLATWLACVMTFFVEWSVEAKFFFIFGCLIGIVLPTAGIIRTRRTYNTQQLASLGDDERAERGELRQIVVFEEEVSFGIQAMEDDLEVEGLWNSKTSTPLHTPLPSPTIPGKDFGSIRSVLAKVSHSRKTSSNTSVSGLDLHEAVLPSSPFVHIVGHRMGADRSVSENACGLRNVRRPNPAPAPGDQLVRPRSVSSPQYLARGHQTHAMVSRMPTSESLCDKTPIISNKKTRTYVIGGTPSSEKDSQTIIQTKSALQDMETLDHTQAHRRFHAAECGQLLHRTEHSPTLAHASSTSRSFDESASEVLHDSRSISWPITQREMMLNMTVSQTRPQKVVAPPVVPFRAFVEMHPPPKMCPSAWTNRTQELVNEKLEARRKISHAKIISPAHSRSSSTASAVAASKTTGASDTFSLCNQTSRKGNESFETLPARTHESFAPAENSSKQYIWRLKSGKDMGKPRKLQKRHRHRSSSDTVTSVSMKYHKERVYATLAGPTY